MLEKLKRSTMTEMRDSFRKLSLLLEKSQLRSWPGTGQGGFELLSDHKERLSIYPGPILEGDRAQEETKRLFKF
jgi:hypothetical protein